MAEPFDYRNRDEYIASRVALLANLRQSREGLQADIAAHEEEVEANEERIHVLQVRLNALDEALQRDIAEEELLEQQSFVRSFFENVNYESRMAFYRLSEPSHFIHAFSPIERMVPSLRDEYFAWLDARIEQRRAQIASCIRPNEDESNEILDEQYRLREQNRETREMLYHPTDGTRSMNWELRNINWQIIDIEDELENLLNPRRA